jgi:hypothetical protein
MKREVAALLRVIFAEYVRFLKPGDTILGIMAFFYSCIYAAVARKHYVAALKPFPRITLPRQAIRFLNVRLRNTRMCVGFLNGVWPAGANHKEANQDGSKGKDQDQA